MVVAAPAVRRVGVACMLLGGNFLDYSVLAADPVAGQHLGIILIELGVGLTVTGVLLSIFHAFAARDSEPWNCSALHYWVFAVLLMTGFYALMAKQST
jgi:hypothetical protein